MDWHQSGTKVEWAGKRAVGPLPPAEGTCGLWPPPLPCTWMGTQSMGVRWD